MKQILITIAAVVLVGCGESQQSAPTEEAKPVDAVTEVPSRLPSPADLQPAETVTEAVNPEPPTGKAPDISIHSAASGGDIEAVKQHLAAGTDVNARYFGATPLHASAGLGRKEIVELLIAEGADVNAGLNSDNEHKGKTPLNAAIEAGKDEIAHLLRKHGAKTGEELKAEGK